MYDYIYLCQPFNIYIISLSIYFIEDLNIYQLNNIDVVITISNILNR